MTKGHVTRDMESAVLKELQEKPVVVLEGARQVGKTTLAKNICRQLNGRYFTLDDPVVLDQLRDDPHLIGDCSQFTVVDEVQLLLKLVRVVKLYADERDRPGLFLITRSSNRFGNKAAFYPLAGRMSNFVMRPFSQCELSSPQGVGRRKKAGHPAAPGFNMIEAILEGRSPPHGKTDSVDRLVSMGTIPGRASPTERNRRWKGICTRRSSKQRAPWERTRESRQRSSCAAGSPATSGTFGTLLNWRGEPGKQTT